MGLFGSSSPRSVPYDMGGNAIVPSDIGSGVVDQRNGQRYIICRIRINEQFIEMKEDGSNNWSVYRSSPGYPNVMAFTFEDVYRYFALDRGVVAKKNPNNGPIWSNVPPGGGTVSQDQYRQMLAMMQNNFSMTLPPQQTKSKQSTIQPIMTFKKGDIVEFVGMSGDSIRNFFVRHNSNIPDSMLVTNGTANVDRKIYDEKGAEVVDIYQEYYIVEYTCDNGNKLKLGFKSENIMKSKKKTKTKAVVLNLKALDKLIMDETTKGEILSVLKQHQNHEKIFKKWGLEDTIEYGKGMTFLFHGGPGTGKTWGATLIAKALGVELLTLDAANIQSSEPGAANRNIQNAFKDAKAKGKVLFLDECDSLIFNRAHLGMVLAGEVNTLLTEIEKFEGVCILATNRVEHMDSALERRISLIVEFKNPDYAQRVGIWKALLPKKFPIKGITAEDLAKPILTGGLIKNVLLNAARMASSENAQHVTKDHFEKAITRVKASKNLMGKNIQHQGGMSTGVSVDRTKVSDIFGDAEIEHGSN